MANYLSEIGRPKNPHPATLDEFRLALADGLPPGHEDLAKFLRDVDYEGPGTEEILNRWWEMELERPEWQAQYKPDGPGYEGSPWWDWFGSDAWDVLFEVVYQLSNGNGDIAAKISDHMLNYYNTTHEHMRNKDEGFVDTMRRLATSRNRDDRIRVATQDGVPFHILNMLAQDFDTEISQLARQQMKELGATPALIDEPLSPMDMIPRKPWMKPPKNMRKSREEPEQRAERAITLSLSGVSMDNLANALLGSQPIKERDTDDTFIWEWWDSLARSDPQLAIDLLLEYTGDSEMAQFLFMRGHYDPQGASAIRELYHLRH